ncbi:crossover junction endodeoxyribonuclease RuvC [Marinilongibacter aquaticus]|uniref:crossover junction endodeoxyribonuclease RuvC n=1 Tax=Marinilongibacter aquaticus TaxID=2975157 RepID=UPI0021BD727B|nr:crossover junction endodeoxyribonuclease RuvC [Marinilongibacter aquaticus]UBM58586.1 crossover junction endodeoxyribonuclease RuvC [Marinilongibacter aquaticus]
MEKNEKIILGVDPGTRIMGYGLIAVKGNELRVVQFGVIRLEKLGSHELKLKRIFERITHILEEYMPDEMAIEAPFYAKNVQSMLKLGRAQGVAMAAALSREVPIVEYLPKKVKQSVTGNGNASKEQVAYMLERLFNHKLEAKFADATDALGVAVCHYMHGKTKALTGNNSSQKGWAAFVSENKDRVKGGT